MIKKLDLVFCDNGTVIHSSESLLQSLFVDPKIIENNCVSTEDNEDIQIYNKWAKIYDLPAISSIVPEIDHAKNQANWFMPEKYKSIDIEEYILSLAKTQQEIDRVTFELAEYKKRNLFNLLKYMVYLRDVVKENNIVLGIGRGSSVSSFILYLLKIHRVNSIKYDLDIKEFLK